jgi:hypothetical protein
MPGERIGALSDLAADGPASYLATVIIPAGAPTEGTARTASIRSRDGSSRGRDTIRPEKQRGGT